MRTLTNKQIYSHLLNLPLPKIVREAPPDKDFKPVWQRLFRPFLTAEEREIQYLLIHGKLPVPEWLFRIGMKNDPYCSSCPGAVIGDIEHFFSACVKTNLAWNWIKSKLLQLSRGSSLTSSQDFLTLFFPNCVNENEVIWLIGKFIYYVWITVFVKGNEVKIEKFIGYLKFKFKNEKLKPLIGSLNQLLWKRKQFETNSNGVWGLDKCLNISVTVKRHETTVSEVLFKKLIFILDDWWQYNLEVKWKQSFDNLVTEAAI